MIYLLMHPYAAILVAFKISCSHLLNTSNYAAGLKLVVCACPLSGVSQASNVKVEIAISEGINDERFQDQMHTDTYALDALAILQMYAAKVHALAEDESLATAVCGWWCCQCNRSIFSREPTEVATKEHDFDMIPCEHMWTFTSFRALSQDVHLSFAVFSYL